MATQAQLDEKARKDRLGVPDPSPFSGIATAAQLAEKTRKDQLSSSSVQSYATAAQIEEKSRREQASSSSTAEFATEAQLAEKVLRDQASFFHTGYATANQLAEKRRQNPPPLPPRASSSFAAPPPYTADDAKRSELISEQWRSHDPRSSSTHSLVPPKTGRDGRRKLLLVFVHGFMGNETSFQSFPAHIHNLLSITLSETHVIHTKIYPRYKSKKAIEFARDDFGVWLEPHEEHQTDVILLGHSMGGLLIAEVALQKPFTPATGKAFQHNILGTINFDTPFLGMHPGVVVSGLGSLFRPAPEPPGRTSSQPSTSGANTPSADSQSAVFSPSHTPSIAGSEISSQLSIVQSITSPLASPSSNDPYFNPAFPNDVRLPERKGWSNLLHFVNKHSDGLTAATKQLFMSHIEFGGAMADYPGLKARYAKIRALEDVDDTKQRNGPGYQPPVRRIRFVNYYTASTGRPKVPKIPPGHMMDADGNIKPIEVEMEEMDLEEPGSGSVPETSAYTEEAGDGLITPQPEGPFDAVNPGIQMQDLGEGSGVHDEFQEQPEMRHIDSMPMEEPPEMQHIDSIPIPDDDDVADAPAAPEPKEDIAKLEATLSALALPPIPHPPVEPPPFDINIYTDKDSRKIAEKEQKRILKAYNQAVKDRESAIKDRKKLLEKREKKARQEQEKQLKAEVKERWKEEQEAIKAETKPVSVKSKPTKGKEKERKPSATPSVTSSSQEKDDKPKRDKKFCMLPPEYGGQRDKCWIRIYMEGVDEVGAHCGLFFQGPQYESLVGDVGARVEKWIKEDAVRRAALGID